MRRSTGRPVTDAEVDDPTTPPDTRSSSPSDGRADDDNAAAGRPDDRPAAAGRPNDRPGNRTNRRPTFLITPMKRRHLRGVVSIENETNQHPWSQNLFLGELRNPTGRIYNVATDTHRVLGFCGLMIVADEGHITTIAVTPDAQRRGIAKRMLGRTVREAVERGVLHLTLEVRVSNRAALEMYRRFGFAPGGVRPRYYSAPVEDALIMWAHDVNTSAYMARLEELGV